jgi:drug/metabolite transporter (DMT)-like permease
MVLVIALGVAAAMLFARAAFLQQQGIHAALDAPDTRDAVHITRNISHLVRQPLWLWGWLTNLAGFLCQAMALHLGSVAVVQPLLTTQLLFTLALVSWHLRIVPGTQAWLGAAAICAGLVILVAVQGAPLSGESDRTKVLLASLVATLSVIVLVAVSRTVRGGALLSAIAAGLCFAMSAVFMKLTMQDLLTVGVHGTARDWPGYFLAASAVSGLLIEQAAFTAEPLTWPVTAMNITNPVAGYLVGILAFQTSVPTDPKRLAGIAVSGLLLVTGVIALAHIPALTAQGRPATSAQAENQS